MINIRIPMILILMLALMACGSGSGDGSGDGSGTDNVGSSGSGSPVEVSLERLSDAEFNALTEEDDEYKLVIGADKNTEAVEILDTTVVDCLEFYDAVANHAELIPTVVSTLVNIFFNGYLAEDTAKIVDDIIEDDPITFNDVFQNIIFSKEYLFLAVVSRKAGEQELNELNAIIADRGFNRNDRKMQQAMIVLDYLSRLSELYFTADLRSWPVI